MNEVHILETGREARHPRIVEFLSSLFSNIGRFERALIDRLSFENIDFTRDGTSYHFDMVRGLLVPKIGEKTSLMLRILEDTDLSPEQIQSVKIEAFKVVDISMDVGTKRDVDRVWLKLNDGRQAVMTVSLDKEPVAHKDDSPSLEEAETLGGIDTDKAWCVQKLYGSTLIEDAKGSRGLICKEYLDGVMLGNYVINREETSRKFGEKHLSRIVAATTDMLANSLEVIGGVPRDSNMFNVIIGTKEDGGMLARYCDVESVRKDVAGISQEIAMLSSDFGPSGKEIVSTLKRKFPRLVV